MTDQSTPSETPKGAPSKGSASERLLSMRVIFIASAVAVLVLGGVAFATLKRDGSGDNAGPSTSSTRESSRITGVSGATGAAGSKDSGSTGPKNGGATGSNGAGPTGGGGIGPTQTTISSDEDADIAKIRVAITPGTCLWDLDTFDLTARGSVRNNNTVDAFADIEVTWLDSEGTELDISSTLEVLSPGETVNWDVAGASIDGPVGALRCTVALLP